MPTAKERKQRTSERKLIKQLGGAKRIHQGLLEYTRRVGLMDSRRSELLEQYPDKWIAMADSEIVAIADSIEDVLKELDEREISRVDAVVEFMDTNPRSMIL